jgi:hypothetical protein
MKQLTNIGGKAMTAQKSSAALIVRVSSLLLTLLIAACGGGGSASAPTAVSTGTNGSSSAARPEASFAITGDDYGVENATYLSATPSGSSMVLRAAVASSMNDPEYKTVSRIDIENPAAVSAGVSYSLAGATPGTPLPGTFYLFNGHQSTLLQTVGGSITFSAFGTNPGDTISGSFTARILDGGDSANPVYTVSANFSFKAGGYGAILPAPVPVPATATSLFTGKCASCHALGNLAPVPGTGPDLALKGGKLGAVMSAGHKGITMAGADLSALKILLNVN